MGVVVIFCCAFVTISTAAQDQTEADVVERFLSEASKQWLEYEEVASMAQGRLVWTQSSTFSPVPSVTIATRRANSHCRSVVLDYDVASETRDEVYAYNGDYLFFLVRNDDNAAWQFKSGDAHKEDATSKSQTVREIDDYAVSNRTFVQLIPIALANLVARPEFEVVSGEWEIISGRRLAKISFACPHDSEADDGQNPFQEGTLWLDPERYWILRKAVATKLLRGGAKMVCSFELTEVDPNSEVPLPKSVQADYVFQRPGEDDAKFHETYDYDLAIPASLPGDSEFTLTAFGLPELDSLANQEIKSPTQVWLLVAIAGILLVILGFAAIRFARSRGSTRSL